MFLGTWISGNDVSLAWWFAATRLVRILLLAPSRRLRGWMGGKLRAFYFYWSRQGALIGAFFNVARSYVLCEHFPRDLSPFYEPVGDDRSMRVSLTRKAPMPTLRLCY